VTPSSHRLLRSVDCRRRVNKLSNLPRWITRNHGIRWHVRHYHRSSYDYAALSDADSFHDDGSPADPNVIFDYDGYDIIVRRRGTGQASNGICGVPWRIKDPHVVRNSALPSNDNLLPNRKVASVADSCVISDDQCWLVGEAGRKGKSAFSVYPNIISDDQLASAHYPMKGSACMHTPAVFGAVRLEEGFAYEDSDNKFVSRAQG